MNKKIAWGSIIIVISIFYAIQSIFPEFLSESVMKYIFNYQIMIIGIGIFFLAKKKNIGWFVLAIGIYLYLQRFLGEYFNKGFPIAMLTGGIVILALGLNERKVKGEKKKGSIFKSSVKPDNVKEEEIQEAEEIKE